MIEVRIYDSDTASFEKAMRTFKKICQKDGFMRELRERRYYKKPSIKKREKRIEAKKNKRR